MEIKGIVTDTDGEPLIGVTVRSVNSSLGTSTDIDGKYILREQSPGMKELIFSYIGMKNITRRIDLHGADPIVCNIVMHPSENMLNEVVVMGMFHRPADSFTGSSSAYDVRTLEESGNANLLTSLKNTDPSFKIDNTLATGSNPNAMPTMQIRGATSLNLKGDYEGNPNQPLFILDGFETPIEKLFDMDMSRVASVTVLKDASAKAIYGSKAGNGVIVVETRRPAEGKPRVYYSGTLNVDTPLLNDYNLMDARTKLEFEASHGMYDRASTFATLQERHDLLKSYRDNIAQGVDTDWLKLATHTGVGTKHSIAIEGGNDHWRYQGGIMYNYLNGVMKGSHRNVGNGNIMASYDNSFIHISNTIDFTYTDAKDSPLGEFSDFVNLNPYLKPYNESGEPDRILAQGEYGRPVYNPLYDATLSGVADEKYYELREAINAEWRISGLFKLSGNFAYTLKKSNRRDFLPYSHSSLEDPDQEGRYFLKGRYDKSQSSNTTLTGNVGLNYSQSVGPHLWFVNAIVNLQTESLRRHLFSTKDASSDMPELNNIEDAAPWLTEYFYEGTDQTTREIGVIGVGSYSFDNRYLADFSIRESGSSVFGRNNRWGCFWSVGIGWNIHNEKFLDSAHWIKVLKLRATTGVTGTQAFNPYQARARYIYLDYLYGGRYGAVLSGLPNDALMWQKIHDTDLGIDAEISYWLNFKFDYFWQTTDNMLSDITLAPSCGFNTYKANLGQMKNQGFEVSLSITPWRNVRSDAWVTLSLSGMHNRNRLTNISNLLETFNKSQNRAKTLPLQITDREVTRPDYEADRLAKTTPSTLYYEGCSTTAIWGVRSIGVDPLTGRRIYLDRNDNITYTWNPDDQVIIGDSAPDISGNITLSGGWKGLSAALSFSYSLGGDIYNTTLVNKVENVTGYDNLDRRILESWQNSGDIAPYRCLTITTSDKMEYSRPTSSFVTKNNELVCNSLNLGYEFSKIQALKSLGFRSLKLSIYVNDLFRLSTVKCERGTSYPYARNYSFNIQASF
ncbi:MAG: SusC/RagA family TonB-linked outer membrane protein [Lepagella sp.]